MTGGGQMADVDELRFAIRKKNAAGIKAVLQKQLTQERIKTLKDQYREKFGDDLNQLLFGRLGAEFAMGPQAAMLGNAGGVVRGRDAAHVEEYLNAVGEKEAGGGKEVDALVKYGKLEVDVTEDNSGAMGALREIGDDPDTQKMMNASSRQLQDLAKAWKANPGNPRLQQAIVAEMRKVRATLTGDATAYEEENEQLRAQLRSAVSFAVQIALAVALPGAGPGIAGFLTSTALNIGATVASNMVIYGDQYSLKMLYNDVVGGGLGALGGKFGEDVAKMVAGNASRGVAGAAVEAGLPATKLAGQVDAAARDGPRGQLRREGGGRGVEHRGQHGRDVRRHGRERLHVRGDAAERADEPHRRAARRRHGRPRRRAAGGGRRRGAGDGGPGGRRHGAGDDGPGGLGPGGRRWAGDAPRRGTDDAARRGTGDAAGRRAGAGAARRGAGADASRRRAARGAAHGHARRSRPRPGGRSHAARRRGGAARRLGRPGPRGGRRRRPGAAGGRDGAPRGARHVAGHGAGRERVARHGGPGAPRTARRRRQPAARRAGHPQRHRRQGPAPGGGQ